MAAISESAVQFLRQTPAPNLPPPASRAGMLGWLRTNLFSSPFNIALTLLAILFIAWMVPPL
jgi:general L-amino acid transport system permease protein